MSAPSRGCGARMLASRGRLLTLHTLSRDQVNAIHSGADPLPPGRIRVTSHSIRRASTRTAGPNSTAVKKANATRSSAAEANDPPCMATRSASTA